MRNPCLVRFAAIFFGSLALSGCAANASSDAGESGAQEPALGTAGERVESAAQPVIGNGAYIGVVGASNLYAWSPFYNDIYAYGDGGTGWSRIGDYGRSYVSSGAGLFGLSINGGGVIQYASPLVWDSIGGSYNALYGAGYGLFGQSYDGSLSRWDGSPGAWSVVSGPARSFVVNDVGLYRLSLDGSSIWSYNNEGLSWSKIGGAASSLYAGADGLFALYPDGLLYRYDNAPFSWSAMGTAIGNPWQSIASTSAGVFGLGLHGGHVYKFDGAPQKWSKVGGQYRGLFGGAYGLYASSLWGDEFFGYSGSTWTSLGRPYN